LTNFDAVNDICIEEKSFIKRLLITKQTAAVAGQIIFRTIFISPEICSADTALDRIAASPGFGVRRGTKKKKIIILG